MGVSGQHHAPTTFYSAKRTLVPIGEDAGWASELVLTQGLEEKSFAPAGDQTPVVQSIVRHHTDSAMLADLSVCTSNFNLNLESYYSQTPKVLCKEKS